MITTTLNEDTIPEFLPQVLQGAMGMKEVQQYVSNITFGSFDIQFDGNDIVFHTTADASFTGVAKILGSEKPVKLAGRLVMRDGKPQVIVGDIAVEDLNTAQKFILKKVRQKIIDKIEGVDINSATERVMQNQGIPASGVNLGIETNRLNISLQKAQ